MQSGRQKICSYRFVGAHPEHQTSSGHLSVDGSQFLNAKELIPAVLDAWQPFHFSSNLVFIFSM
jgi:hypothetical protein